MTDFRGCSPGDMLPGGGWAPTLEECAYTISGYDGQEFLETTDEKGCPLVAEIGSQCGLLVPDEP